MPRNKLSDLARMKTQDFCGIVGWNSVSFYTIPHSFDVLRNNELLFYELVAGLILHRGSYLRNMWNIMDFVVVVTG